MKRPQGDAAFVLTRADGQKATVTVTLRIDTATEVEYYQHGGILPFVLRQLLQFERENQVMMPPSRSNGRGDFNRLAYIGCGSSAPSSTRLR